MHQFAALLTRDRFAPALLFAGLTIAACLIPAQSDTWWQLRAGSETWRAGHVALHDDFTHTVAGRPWPNHEWLTQVVFYGVYSLGGLPLLTLFCAAAIAAAWWLVSRLTPGPPLIRVALVGFGAVMSSPAWCLRPQVLTLTMCAATLVLLARGRHLWALPPLFLLWANLHGAVALGGVLVLAAWIGFAVYERSRLPQFTVIALVCLAATAMTPLGFSLWFMVPHSLERLQDYGVIEWRAPSVAHPSDLAFWATGAALALLGLFKRRTLRSRETLTLFLSAALLFVLGTRSIRNVAPFVVCAVPALAALLETGALIRSAPRRESSRALALNGLLFATVTLGGVLFIAAAWSRPLPRLAWEPVSTTAMAAIDSCPGRLYNRYDEGGYLIWFMPHRKVFMDSRQDPFPPELVLGHIQLERTGEYQPIFERYDISCALSVGGSPLARALERDGWTGRAAGNGWMVYQSPVGSRQSSVDHSAVVSR